MGRDQIAAELQTGNWNQRIHAVHALDPHGEAGLPELRLAARDYDWQVRLTAVHFLGRVGKPAIEDLKVSARREPCRHVRLSAVNWLASLGVTEIPAPGDFGRKPDQFGCLKGIDQGEQAPPPEAEISQPQDEDFPVVPPEPEQPAPPPPMVAPDRRWRELDVLLGEEEPAFEPPPIAMEEPTLENPIRLPQTLPAMGPGSEFRLSEHEAGSLASVSRKGAPSEDVKAYREREERPSSPGASMRGSEHGVAGPLADHGSPQAAFDRLPSLLEELKSADRRRRARAADELGKLGLAAAPAVPALMAKLSDKAPQVRASAALALGNIGEPADAAVPGLVRALRDKNEEVQVSAASALGRMGTPSARRAFRKHLRGSAGGVIKRAD